MDVRLHALRQLSIHNACNEKKTSSFYVAAQAERIYKNIGYAISTRSNHTISEAFGLWMVGLLFPELKHAEKYLLIRKTTPRTGSRQSNLPRWQLLHVLPQLPSLHPAYLFVCNTTRGNQTILHSQLNSSTPSPNPSNTSPASSTPKQAKCPSTAPTTAPLFLPLNNCDFTDYRPLLQLGWYITKGERLFEAGPWDEDVFWICGEVALIPSPSPEGRREPESPSPRGRGVRGEGEVSFPNGGVHLLRSTNSHALIRCTDFTSRPSHADQLHVDLWIHGHNIAIDAGTYLYSGQGHWRNGLAHTSAHNTVTVDNKDQMTMLSRFTWTNWSKGKVLKHDKDIWQGEHDGYKPVSHKRTVMSLEGDRWLVIDNLVANESHHYALHWLLAMTLECRSLLLDMVCYLH